MRGSLWNSHDAALATGGRNTCDWEASGLSIDTRTLKKGDMFIAISASRDGHNFVAEAFGKGASAALVSCIPQNVPRTQPMLIVKDVSLALEALALFRRKRFEGKIIAITGSVGKTSSKDMLAMVLSSFGKVSKAERSLNNHLGVPLTLARTPADTDFLVVEIGMSNKKEIEPLSLLVRPHIALITDVSEAHLASFENVDEIAKEKSDICCGLQEGGTCIVSSDSQKFTNLIKCIQRFGVKTTSYGENRISNYKLVKTVIKNNKTCAQATLENGSEFFLKVNSPGVHHAKNALGIIAVLEVLELDPTKGILGLLNWFPASGRGLVTNIQCEGNYRIRHFTIIDETYNANPSSVTAALNLLANFSKENDAIKKNYQPRRIAILGDMLELGTDENNKHRELALTLNFDELDLIFCIGTRMKYFYNNLPDSKKGKWVKSVNEILGDITDLIKDQDIIMLKASNRVGLNLLLKELKAMGHPS